MDGGPGRCHESGSRPNSPACASGNSTAVSRRSTYVPNIARAVNTTMPPSVPVAGIGFQMKIRIMIASAAPNVHTGYSRMYGASARRTGVHSRDGPANQPDRTIGGADEHERAGDLAEQFGADRHRGPDRVSQRGVGGDGVDDLRFEQLADAEAGDPRDHDREPDRRAGSGDDDPCARKIAEQVQERHEDRQPQRKTLRPACRSSGRTRADRSGRASGSRSTEAASGRCSVADPRSLATVVTIAPRSSVTVPFWIPTGPLPPLTTGDERLIGDSVRPTPQRLDRAAATAACRHRSRPHSEVRPAAGSASGLSCVGSAFAISPPTLTFA